MIYISEISEQDLSGLALAYMKTFNSDPWFERWVQSDAKKRLQDLYQSPNFDGLMLLDGKTPIGGVFGRKERFFDGDSFRIDEFWIQRSFQDNGYGTALMEKLREQLAGSVKSIYLITMHNPKTAGFYQKSGFSVNDGFCIMHLNMQEKS